jgi:hypothetical protein
VERDEEANHTHKLLRVEKTKKEKKKKQTNFAVGLPG